MKQPCPWPSNHITPAQPPSPLLDYVLQPLLWYQYFNPRLDATLSIVFQSIKLKRGCLMVFIVPSTVKKISETSEGAWASISGILCKLLTRNWQFGAHFLAKMIFFTASQLYNFVTESPLVYLQKFAYCWWHVWAMCWQDAGAWLLPVYTTHLLATSDSGCRWSIPCAKDRSCRSLLLGWSPEIHSSRANHINHQGY